MFVNVDLVKETIQEVDSKEVCVLVDLDSYFKEIEHLISFVFLDIEDQVNVNFEEIKNIPIEGI